MIASLDKLVNHCGTMHLAFILDTIPSRGDPLGSFESVMAPSFISQTRGSQYPHEKRAPPRRLPPAARPRNHRPPPNSRHARQPTNRRRRRRARPSRPRSASISRSVHVPGRSVWPVRSTSGIHPPKHCARGRTPCGGHGPHCPPEPTSTDSSSTVNGLRIHPPTRSSRIRSGRTTPWSVSSQTR